MSSEEPQPYLHLYAVMNQREVDGLVRTYCTDDEISNLPTILAAWRQARTSFEQIQQQEQGIPNNPTIVPIEQNEKLTALQNDLLVQRSFLNTPFTFGMVDIDTLVAPQRQVYL